MEQSKIDIARFCLALGSSTRTAASYSGVNRTFMSNHPELFSNIVDIASNRQEVFEIFEWLDRKQIKLAKHINSLGYDLPEDYLSFLFFSQHGQCFYTGRDLSLSKEDRFNSVSIDRVDTSQGYLVGNIVLTSSRINMVKSDATFLEMAEWMPGFYKKITDNLSRLNCTTLSKITKYKKSLPTKFKVTSKIRAQYCELEDYFNPCEDSIFKFEVQVRSTTG